MFNTPHPEKAQIFMNAKLTSFDILIVDFKEIHKVHIYSLLKFTKADLLNS